MNYVGRGAVSLFSLLYMLLGLTMNEDSVYLLLEYCTNGPVDQYLQKHERQFRNKFLDHTYDEMLKWSIQISDAMGFLAQNNIIHVSLFASLF